MTQNSKRRGLAPATGLVLALMLALGGCKPIEQNHGYVPTDAELALITVGADTRDTVAATIGRPSASGLLDQSGWYYVKSRYSTLGLLPRQEGDRQVVAISFDDRGVVTNVERFGLQEGRVVPISRRVTSSNVRGQSFLRQLFGNIGVPLAKAPNT